MDEIRAKMAKLNEDLSRLTAEFENATEEKLKCANEVAKTEKTIHLANRYDKRLLPSQLTRNTGLIPKNDATRS